MHVSDRNVDFQNQGRWSISQKKHPRSPQNKLASFFCAFETLQNSVASRKNVGKIPTPKSRVFTVFKTVERLWLKKLQQSHEAQWVLEMWMFG